MEAISRTLRESPVHLFRATNLLGTAPYPSRDASLHKVRPGVYAARDAWNALDPWDRYLVRVHAFALVRADAVFSHESAASVLGLPTFGHPRNIHIFDTRRSRSVAYGDVTAHTSADARSVQRVGGIHLTTVEDLVVDLARVLPPAFGLAVADAALRDSSLSRDEVIDHAAAQRNTFRMKRVEWVLTRATPLSESAGESLSRAVIEWCGFPAPTLQMTHRLEGRTYRSDFSWPEQKVIGESDGWLKYGGDDPVAAAEAVRAEKRREDSFRRAGWRVARWDYAGALGADGLRAALAAAGLAPSRRADPAALGSVGRNPRSR